MANHLQGPAMHRLRLAIAIIVTATLQACMSVPTAQHAGTVASTSTAAAPQRMFVFSWGMFGDPVFDRDVVTFNRAFSAAYGAPTQAWMFGANARQLTRPTIENTSLALSNMAQQARDGEDLVVVMLTSHGSPDVVALQTDQGGPIVSVNADQLAGLLAPLRNDLQILILQSCFSGSLIDELQSPNRIIMTAAAADRSTFGCNPDSDNTWFIKSLNRAMAQGGSWQQVFATTQNLVATDEAAQGVRPSNPQSFVGGNMRGIWTRNAR